MDTLTNASAFVWRQIALSIPSCWACWAVFQIFFCPGRTAESVFLFVDLLSDLSDIWLDLWLDLWLDPTDVWLDLWLDLWLDPLDVGLVRSERSVLDFAGGETTCGMLIRFEILMTLFVIVLSFDSPSVKFQARMD